MDPIHRGFPSESVRISFNLDREIDIDVDKKKVYPDLSCLFNPNVKRMIDILICRRNLYLVTISIRHNNSFRFVLLKNFKNFLDL